MAEEDNSYRLSFLYKIIDDSQETIRYLDTKAGFGIAILGAILGKFLLDEAQLHAIRSHGSMIIALFVVLGILMVISAALGFKTVFPMINPAENVSFPDVLEPKFFISELGVSHPLRHLFSGKRFATLGVTHAEYCRSLREANAETIESILAAEVLKLSFIRQMKTDRLTQFAFSLILTVSLFSGLMFATPREVQKPVQSGCNCTMADQSGVHDVYNFAPAHSNGAARSLPKKPPTEQDCLTR